MTTIFKLTSCGSPVNDAEVGACGKVGPMERTTGPGRKGRDEIWTCLFLLALSLWQSAHLCAPPSAASVPAWESAEGAGWMMSSTAVDFSANSRTQKDVFPSRLPSQTSQPSPINHQPSARVNPPSFAIPTPITLFACNHLWPPTRATFDKFNHHNYAAHRFPVWDGHCPRLSPCSSGRSFAHR